MARTKSLEDRLLDRQMTLVQLIELSGLDERVVTATVERRYTPSPEQRRRIAAALGVEVDEIAWGHSAQVEHMHGHGPQFGRSP